MKRFKLFNKKDDMKVQKHFYKCQTNGKIKKILRETYLRNDISCGIEECNICENKKKKLLNGKKTILIVDMYNLVNHIDFFYNCEIDNILILGTIYERIKMFNKVIFNKLYKLCYDIDDADFPNRNKRYVVFVNKFCKFTYVDTADEYMKAVQEIIKVVIWIKHHYVDSQITVISDNNMLKEDCLKNDITCSNLFEYARHVKEINQKPLFDEDILKMYFEEETRLLTQGGNLKDENDKEGTEYKNNAYRNTDTNKLLVEGIEIEKEGEGEGTKKALFEPYLSTIDMIKKLREGQIRRGMFQVICVNKLAMVKLSEEDVIIIKGSKNMNRAIHNDVVAVEIFPKEEEIDDEIDDEIGKGDDDEYGDKDEVGKKEKEKELNTLRVMENQNVKESERNIKIEDIEEEEEYFEELVSPDEDDDLDFDSSDEQKDSNESIRTKNKNKSKGTKRYGKIVGIISRDKREYGGMIKEYFEDKSANIKKLRFFKAFNNKIPFIIIKTKIAEDLYNKRVIVIIDSWDIYSKYPLGRCMRVIGNCDDIETETKLIYHEFDISNKEFSEAVYRCLPPNNWVIPKEEYTKRKDFRNILTFSIDPVGCQDIDDALSVEVNKESGLIYIGVHIADVTYFVKQNSALDIEASKRCTTVYLINERTDMLPKLLTTNLCSLIANEERLTYSCVFTFDEKYNVIDINVYKGIIKSNKSFSYEEAQNVIDNIEDTSETAKALRLLNNIAKYLKQLWIKDGALELKSSSEVLFEFEDSDFFKTKNMKPYTSYETNKLIEAFMLLANKSIGNIIFQKFKSASILRRHPTPKENCLKELKAYLESIGISDFNYSTSKELLKSINDLQFKRDENLSIVLKMLTTKCMNEALFICGHNVQNKEMLRHYGLAANVYTFFTSPIRRYADIMVHRVLNHIYDVEELHNKYTDVVFLNKQIQLLNEKNRNARFASRASVDFFSYLYFKKIGNQVTPAIIISLKKNGIQIYIPAFSIEGVCFLKKKNGFIYEEEKKRFKKVDDNGKEMFYLNFYDQIEVYIHVDSSEVKCQNQFTFLKKIVSSS